MSQNELELVVGKDPQGIERVWGEHRNFDIADTYARAEAARYIKERPDTGPLSRWTFAGR